MARRQKVPLWEPKIKPTPEEEAMLDRRYDEIVAKYPNGVTVEQYRRITLECADQEGKIWPHPIDLFARHSILFGMMMDGLIEWRWGQHGYGPWYITDKGRAAVSAGERSK